MRGEKIFKSHNKNTEAFRSSEFVDRKPQTIDRQGDTDNENLYIDMDREQRVEQ